MIRKGRDPIAAYTSPGVSGTASRPARQLLTLPDVTATSSPGLFRIGSYVGLEPKDGFAPAMFGPGGLGVIVARRSDWCGVNQSPCLDRDRPRFELGLVTPSTACASIRRELPNRDSAHVESRSQPEGFPENDFFSPPFSDRRGKLGLSKRPRYSLNSALLICESSGHRKLSADYQCLSWPQRNLPSSRLV
jgi:hypothetical protein